MHLWKRWRGKAHVYAPEQNRKARQIIYILIYSTQSLQNILIQNIFMILFMFEKSLVIQWLFLLAILAGSSSASTLSTSGSLAPVVVVRLTRTTTTTIYRTRTDVLLSGTFVASYNIVEIKNKKGSLPEFSMTAYSQIETFSDTWRSALPITTTTQLYVGTFLHSQN